MRSAENASNVVLVRVFDIIICKESARAYRNRHGKCEKIERQGDTLLSREQAALLGSGELLAPRLVHLECVRVLVGHDGDKLGVRVNATICEGV